MSAKEPIKLVPADSTHLVVAKRRVPVRIRTAEDLVLEGDLYADVQRLDGSKATIVDRLGDANEAYLPIASKKAHILLPKAAIVSILLPDGEVAAPCEGAREHKVRFYLSKGPVVSGTIHTLLPPAQSRLLDYLNRSGDPFFAIRTDGGVVLVNRTFVARVEEQHGLAVHASEPNSRNAASPDRQPGSVSRHVLIVDDDDDFRRLLDNVFRGLGYRVHAVVDGASALDWLSSNHTDVVLLDLKMPASGIEVLRTIRRRSSELPVIVLSEADDDLRRETVRSGAYECLSKPVDLRSLQDRVFLATV